MPRYRVNLDLFIEAEDPEEVRLDVLDMAENFDYYDAHFSQRGDIVELPEDDECDATS